MAKPCPVVDVELPKKTRRICDAVEREKKKLIQSPSYEVEWLYKVLCSSGPGSPVFVGINVRLLSCPMAFSLGMNIDF